MNIMTKGEDSSTSLHAGGGETPSEKCVAGGVLPSTSPGSPLNVSIFHQWIFTCGRNCQIIEYLQ